MAKLSGITTPSLTYDEGAAPSTPAAGKVIIYAKADGLLYSKDDAGTETLVSGGAGGGSVATDAIWDAKGDLAAGTGANTASKLTVGTNGHSLVADSAQSTGLKWAQPAGTLLGYVADTSGVHTTTSTTIVDVDATNCAVTFTAPASGNVLVRLTAQSSVDQGGGSGGLIGDYMNWGVRESTTTVAGPNIVDRLAVDSATAGSIYRWLSVAFVVTGISAGSHTYKWAYYVNNARTTGRVSATSSTPAIIEVWAL